MKKNVVLVLSIIYLLVSFVLPAYAAKKEYPVNKISGIMDDVKIEKSRVHIKFKDGRIIAFDGNYTGQVFETGKECTIKYQYFDVMFAQGEYIIEIKCKQ